MECRYTRVSMDTQAMTPAQSVQKGSFLQSLSWGLFQVSVHTEAISYTIFDENTQIELMGYVYPLIGKLQFIYFPRIELISKEILETLLLTVKQQGFVFVRFDPTYPMPEQEAFRAITVKTRQPEATIALNLDADFDTLLTRMHSKTRYNIRLAQKKGVEVVWGKNMPVFLSLLAQTTARDQFKGHDKAYYAKMLEQNMTHQVTAYLNGVPIASNILIHYAGTVTYLHGTSANEYRNVMAPYLLQAAGIEYALTHDAQAYDFWGVAPTSEDTEKQACFNGYCYDSTHPLAGVTRFKAGFGGIPIAYSEGVEYVLNNQLYALFTFAKKIKNLIK